MDIRFKYGDVPTIKKFWDSDAFLRGLMGPFGCLPADTEFLSLSGWKRMDAYLHGDKIAQWHSDDSRIEFVLAQAYVREDCSDFIQFDSGSLVMQLSSGHRVPHYDWKGAFSVKTAEQIARRPSRREIPTTFVGHDIDALGMSDDMIRFAVMMHADGHYPRPGKGRQSSVCFRKDRKKLRAKELLGRLKIPYREFSYPKRPTEVIYKFIAPYVGKRYTGRWWGASRRELGIVLEEMRYWDGHINECLFFSSKHREDAEYIQYAAHANGLRASFREITYSNPKWAPNYRIDVRIGDNAKNVAAIREHTKIARIPSVDGKMYCFTVPTGFFVARCRGTIFVTGNSGKSSGCVMEVIRRAQKQKPGPDGIKRTRWAVIRSTFPQLEDTTIRTFHQWCPPGVFGQWRASDHQYIINAIEKTHIEVLFRALDRPEHVRNLLSMELTGAWINEARETPWPIIQALQGRVGRYPPMRDGGASWYGVFMDTNPPDLDSWWYKLFEETRPKNAAIFKQPSGRSKDAENKVNLPANYYENLIETAPDPDWIKVYVDGQYGFVIDGKPVYPEYNDSVHCKECSPVDYEPIYRGYDFGLTPSCVYAQLTPKGQLIVFDELTADSMGADQFGDDVIAHSTRRYPGAMFIDIGDPAGEQRSQTDEKTCFQIFQAKGIDIEAGLQTVAIRLESVKKPLRTMIRGQPMFLIHPRCKVLRKGFQGGYTYRRMNTIAERYTSSPDKGPYSHAQDALQYLCTRLFGEGLTAPRQMKDKEADDFSLEHGLRSEVTGY